MADHDDLVVQFCELTGASADRATQYLTASKWDISSAVASFFADDEEEAEEPAAGSSSQATAPQDYTGPRTLDGRPAPKSAVQPSGSSKKPVKKKGLATLGSLRSGSGHDHDEDDDDDDNDDDSDRKGPRDLFAGGEKSGLAVQDPARHSADPERVIKDILAKAKANAKRATSEEETPGPSRSSNFRGGGVTVGGEGTESRRIPDPRGPPAREELPTVTRTLHLWRDGFSIEDGPLRRYSDPEHAMDLQMIRSGRAPLHLMDVEHGQRCDVRLQQHEEDWHQLPRIYRPFAGQGRRLGSPVPGAGSGPSTPAEAAPAPSVATAPAAPAAPSNVDNSQPTVAIRFQLPDGSRLPARFNLSNTIDDLYQFASNTSPEMRSRSFIIQSTFPSKDHIDREQKLEDIDAFKRGGIAVVKWA
ncbi:SEP-domain-containing protein [Cryphonectria parasitica EP155]|uniref:SEP-domain-containing protein n=1 Tax=Cryphonectria parasitica (strain ATCC 38755 / EP155) TaxID=660469 RepID=A0A9P5CWX6_CRYP1|nr:SEP-domain-containing protein [Cryphonectria parasitica EP155]KAF3771335.1 SEP-domain-containing protein [Cryphonectria parasitica EP155]